MCGWIFRRATGCGGPFGMIEKKVEDPLVEEQTVEGPLEEEQNVKGSCVEEQNVEGSFPFGRGTECAGPFVNIMWRLESPWVEEQNVKRFV
jgi:hypothetical protein